MSRSHRLTWSLLAIVALFVTVPAWALIAAPTISPANLSPTGGVVTVKANVTFPGGVRNVQAQIFRDGGYDPNVGSIWLNANGSSTYSGAFTLGPNRDNIAHTYTAIIIATDNAGNTNVLPAAGSCLLATDNTPPTITAATVAPASIPSTGGTLRLQATVIDSGTGIATVKAQVRVNGVYPYYYSWWAYTSLDVTLSNGGAGSVYTGAITLPANTSGQIATYTAAIAATDAAGNTGSVMATGACTQASTTTAVGPPVVSAATISPANLPVAGGNIIVSATVTDTLGANPGVQSVGAQLFQDNYYLTDIPLNSIGNNNYSYTYTINNTGDPFSHVYTAAVYATDYDNNVTSKAADGSTMRAGDTTPPAISAASLTPGTLTALGGTLNLTATVTDTGSGVGSAGFNIRRDGQYLTNVAGTPTGNVYTASYAVPANTDGMSHVYTAYAVAVDNVGNRGVQLLTGSCAEANDCAGPTITAATVTPTALPATGGSLTVSANVTDANGVNAVYANLYLNGVYYSYYNMSNGGAGSTYTTTFGAPANQTGSAQTLSIVIQATDTVNNNSYLTATPTVSEAGVATGPLVSAPTLTPATLPATGGNLNVSATVTDAGGGISTIYARIYRDGIYNIYIVLSNGGSGSSYTGTCGLGVNADSSVHTWTASIEAYDNLSRVTYATCSGSCVQATDHTPPVISAATLTPATLPIVGGTLAVTATVTDTGGSNTGVQSVQAQIICDGVRFTTISLNNDGSGSVYTGTQNVDINRGLSAHVYTAVIMATDVVGNSSTKTATGTPTQPADNVGPTIMEATLTPKPSSQPAAGGSINVSAMVTDAGSGVQYVYAEIHADGGFITQVRLSNGGSGTSYTGSYAFGASGNTAINWSAVVYGVDNCNNMTSVTASGTYIQPATSTAYGPTIGNANITPTTIPTLGGSLTVSADVTDADGVVFANAQIFRNGVFYHTIALNPTGNNYANSCTVGANDDNVAYVFSAVIITANNRWNYSYANAVGSCTQTNDNVPPVITSPSITPSFLPATGGTLTVTATVTDAGVGVQYNNINATILQDGAQLTSITLSNGGNGSSYSGSYSLGVNAGSSSHVYTAVIYAYDQNGNQANLAAVGACTQAGNAAGPLVTTAMLTPETLPATGGTLFLSATVTDSTGVQSVHATVFQDGVYYNDLNLGLTYTSGNAYSSIILLPSNNTGSHIYTAKLLATNTLNNTTLATFSGSCTQNADNQPPVIGVTSVTPPVLPAAGGSITVTANVTDAGTGVHTVYAYPYKDGMQLPNWQTFSLSKGAGGASYTGSFSLPASTDIVNHTYTFTLQATDGAGNVRTAPVSGSCLQQSDYSGAAVTAAAITPATLPAAGGPITVTATVTGTSMTVTARVLCNGSPATTIALSNGGSGTAYSGIYTAASSTVGCLTTYTAAVYAANTAGQVSSMLATGQCVQAAGAAEGPLPAISAPVLIPATLPVSGGPITITATVTDPIQPNCTVQAYLYQNGANGSQTPLPWSISLSNNGTGTSYSGTYNVGVNTTSTTRTFTAVIAATDGIRSNSMPAVGATVQPNDSTYPTITAPALTTASTISATANSLIITATVTDAGGVQNVVGYIYRNGQYQNIIFWLSNKGMGNVYCGSYNIPLNNSASGIVWTAGIQATDNVGNVANVAVPGAITQPNDITGPTITAATMTPSYRPSSGGSVTLTATVTDAGSGLSSVSAHIRYNGIIYGYTNVSLTNGGSGNVYTGVFSFSANNWNTAMTWTAYIVATDNCGNVATKLATGACVQPPITPSDGPTISNATMTPPGLPSAGGTINFSAKVINLPIADQVNAQIFKDNGYFEQIQLSDSGGGNFKGTDQWGSNSDPISHVYTSTILAWDPSQNVVNASLPATGTTTQATDNTGPAISAINVSPTTISASGGTLTISASVTDPAGVQSVWAQIFLNGVYQYYTYLSNTSGSTYSSTYGIGSNQDAANRIYSVVIVATDALLNTSSSTAPNTVTQAYDQTGPTIPASSFTISPTTLPATGGQLTIKSTAAVTDPSGVASVIVYLLKDGNKYDQQSLTLPPTPQTLTFSLGVNKDPQAHVYTAYVYALDNLNNLSTAPVVGSTTQACDTTPPVLTSVSLTPSTMPASGDTIALSATATDDTGIASVQATLMMNGVEYQVVNLDNGGSGSSYTANIAVPANLDRITHTFSAVIAATDLVGNIQTVAAPTTCVQANDSSGPTITGATLTPSSRPTAGGTLYVNATITDSNGIAWVKAYLYANGVYYTSFGLGNGGSGSGYTGEYAFPANATNQNITWTAVVNAQNTPGRQSTVTATGSCAQPATTVKAGPTITLAAITPANLPSTGGVTNLSATVTTAAGPPNVRADLFVDALYLTTVGMNNGGSGTAYTASYAIPVNADSTAHVYTATVYADDINSLRTTVLATGSTILAATTSAPTIASPTISPATLPSTGGYLNLTATVTGYCGLYSVQSLLYRDGVYWAAASMNAQGTANSYAGSYYIGTNSDAIQHVFTAVISATDLANIISSVSVPGNCIQATDSELPSFVLTPSAGASGTISPNDPQSVKYDNSFTFSASANYGYTADTWTLDGVTAQTGGGNYTVPNVQANHAVKVTFTLQTFTITPTAGANGAISPSTAQTVTFGGNITFTAVANAAYTSDTWSVDGVNVQTTGATYTLTNVKANHTVKVTFKLLPTYTVTPSAGANGAISPSTAQTIYWGGNLTFGAVANTGYTADTWSLDGTTVQTGGANYTVANVLANHTVKVTFKILTYTVTPSAGANGTISPSTIQTVNYGSSTAFIAVANAGYTTDTWSLDGVNVQSSGASYTLTNITANHTVKVTFKILTYTITPSAGANGAISPSSVQIVNYGSSTAFIAVANAGYTTDTWSLDGVNVQSSGATYTLANVKANHTVKVTFKILTYSVTPTAGANGTINPSTAQTVNYGNSLTFTAAANAGYTASNWALDGVNVQSSGATYTLSNVTANHTVNVTFKILTYSVTPTAGANGTISPNSLQTLNYGSAITFTALPNAGYTAINWSLDGVNVQSTGATYTLANVKANHTVNVTFKILTFTLTPSAGSNGTISPSTPLTVNYGSSTAFTAVANVGYTTDTWSLDGLNIQTGGATYTVTNVTASHAVKVTFKLLTYTVTPSAGTGGTISPNTAQTENYGGSVTFTATANTGYTASNWALDGVNVQSSGATYTLSNVKANHTVNVTFRIFTYTVTPSAGPNGTISPSTVRTVNYGSSTAFTAVANAGYTTDTWSVDGLTVQTGGATYTLSNVTANHTVKVTFKTIPIVRQPDLLIRTSSETAYTGGGIYNTDGTNQTKTQIVPDGASACYLFRIQNNGNSTDTFLITASAGVTSWSMTYYDMTTGSAITGVITTTGWSTGPLAPDDKKGFFVQVTPAFTVTPNSIKTVQVTAVSVGDNTKKDVVKGITTGGNDVAARQP